MKDLDQQAIQITAQFLEEKLGRPVSEEEARQAAHNMYGFVQLLQKWDRARRNKEKVENKYADPDHAR